MKKKLLVIIVIIMTMLTACGGVGDWRYSELPGDFSIWRINASDVSLCKDITETSADKIIGPYISEISYNEEYIFAKKVDVPEGDSREIDYTNPEYYILVVEGEELYGPYTETGFSDKCMEIEIIDIPEWTKTTKLTNKQY